MRRRTMLLTAVFPILLMAAGCGSGGDGPLGFIATPTPTPTPTPTARLRVVHASPDAPNVDVLVDNVLALSNVPYLAASNYLNVAPGTRNIRVNATGAASSVINANVTLGANSDTTVIAVNRLATIAPLVLTDNNTAPATGQVRVRAVHAASGVANVDIYVTAPTENLATTAPTLSNVAYRGVSPYLSVPAGTYRIRITPADTKTVAIDTGAAGVALTTGRVYTAIAIGDTGVTPPRTPTAILLTDR